MGHSRNLRGTAVMRAVAHVATLAGALMSAQGAAFQSDLDALREAASINPSFNQSATWIGDPCNNNTWAGVNCNTTTGRVLSLKLTGLTGAIPAALGNLSALSELLLCCGLNGSIPSELGSLANLQTLSLAGNRLTGPIPGGATGWPLGTDLTGNYLNGTSSGFATARNFSLGLNCFDLSSSRVYEFGQRDAGACAAYYPDFGLQCSCPPEEALGIDTPCACVLPLRFVANFTYKEPGHFGEFTRNLLSTLNKLAVVLGEGNTPANVQATDVSDDGRGTVTLRVNVLPASGAKNFTVFRNQSIFGSVNGTMRIVNITFFDPGPVSFESVIVASSTPPKSSTASPPPPRATTGTKASPTGLIAGTSIGGLLAATVALGLALWLRRRRRRQREEICRPVSTTIDDTSVKQWMLSELQAATNNFDKAFELGRGGFAIVYKAVLGEDTLAVKRLSGRAFQSQGQEEFIKEVKTVGNIHNRNLVTLRGYCIEGEECLLIYDYIANGSLEDRLFGKNSPGPLNWDQCVTVLVGTANGIAYLHEGCKEKMIHRDIKPANILLDEDFNPHVADFGLVKSAMIADTHVSTKVAGTMGYLAPEYANSGQLTEKSDVFSFGVLIFVVIGHRAAIDTSADDEFVSIVERAFNAVQNDRWLDLVAPHLSDAYDEDQARRLISIGILCTQPSWQERPAMGYVYQMLNGNIPIPDIQAVAMATHHVTVTAFAPYWSSSQGSSGTDSGMGASRTSIPGSGHIQV